MSRDKFQLKEKKDDISFLL